MSTVIHQVYTLWSSSCAPTSNWRIEQLTPAPVTVCVFVSHMSRQELWSLYLKMSAPPTHTPPSPLFSGPFTHSPSQSQPESDLLHWLALIHEHIQSISHPCRMTACLLPPTMRRCCCCSWISLLSCGRHWSEEGKYTLTVISVGTNTAQIHLFLSCFVQFFVEFSCCFGLLGL